MLYVKLDENGNAIAPPVPIRYVLRELSHVSLPRNPTDEDLAPFRFATVPSDTVGPPDVPPGYSWRLAIPEKVDGKWVRRWDIYEMSEQEVNARLNDLRRRRDRLLAESDWTQIPDSSLSEFDKTLWALYRQELRDLPSSPTLNLKKIQWPIKPLV